MAPPLLVIDNSTGTDRWKPPLPPSPLSIDAESAVMEHDSQEIRVCALVLSVLAFFLFIAAEIVPSEDTLVHTLVALGTLGFAWIGPLTLLAVTIKAPTFKWWQLFQGGSEFIWMQAFGWSLHTLVLTGAIVILANNRPVEGKWMEGQYLVLGISGFVAQLLLNLSISIFEDSDEDSAASYESKTTKRFPWNVKAIVSMFMSISAALLFLFFELYGHRLQSNAVIIVACAEYILSSLMIHAFYGAREIPGYKLWQPFEGERTFLLLQYLGWQFFAGMIVGTLMLCGATDFSATPAVSRGAPTAVGAIGMISQIVLLFSLQHFSPPEATLASTSMQTPLTRRPPEVYVSALLCAAALLVSCVSYAARFDVTGGWQQLYLQHEKIFWAVNVLALLIASPIAHFGAARAVPGFNWWQPFIGGTKFVFLQTLGWLWYGIFVAMSLLLTLNDAKFAEIAGPWTLFIGCASAAAIMTSLPLFTLPETETSSSDAAVDAVSTRKPMRQLMLHHGEVAISLMMTLSSVISHVVADYIRKEDTDDAALASRKTQLRSVALILGTLLFGLGCFVSHASGRRLYDRYRFFQPFEGGVQYVVWQAIGWTLVAVLLLGETLVLCVPESGLPFGVVSGVGVLELVPHLAIITSVRYFQPSAVATYSGTPASGKRRHRKRPTTLLPLASMATTSQRIHPTAMKSWTQVLQARPDLRWLLLVTGVVIFGALLLFACADACHNSSRFRHADKVLYCFGLLVALGGILLIHCGLGPRIQPDYRSLQPFSGGLRFVTFQGVAWTLSSVGGIGAATALYWHHVFFQLRAIHTLTAVVFAFAQCTLLHSLPLFRPPVVDADSAFRSSLLSSTTSTSSLLWKLEMLTHEFFVGPLLGLAACVVFVLVDVLMLYWGPSIPVFPVTVCAVLALFSAIPMSYRFTRSTMGRQAKALGGSVVFLVLGSALWSFTILLGALFCLRVWGSEGSSTTTDESADIYKTSVQPSTTSSLTSPCMGTITALVGFIAQLVFFQASYFKKWNNNTASSGSPTLSRAGAARAAARRAKKHLLSVSRWFYSSAAIATGCCYAYLASLKRSRQVHVTGMALCSLAVLACAYGIQRHILLASTNANKSSGQRYGNASASGLHLLYEDDSPMVQLEMHAFANVAAFLTVAELVRVSATCRRLHADQQADPSFWRSQFLHRFAAATTPTIVPVPPSSTLVHPFAASWLTAFEDLLLNAVCRLHLYVAGKPDLQELVLLHRQTHWQTLCITRELHGSCEICEMCGKLEVLSEISLEWEQRNACSVRVPTTWIRLCHCIHPATHTTRKAHRACLEKLQEPVAPCTTCLQAPVPSVRYPLTLRELRQITWADFRTGREDFAGGFFSFVPLAVLLVVYSARSFKLGCPALYVWIFFAMAICFVSNTPRIAMSLERIGGDEHSYKYSVYQRLVHALTLPSLVHVFWCLSSAPLGVLDVALAINFVLQSAFASALLALFWRASYRVQTFTCCPPPPPPQASAMAPTTPTSRTQTGEQRDHHAEDLPCIACVLELCSLPVG